MIFKCYNLVLRWIRGAILHSIAIEPSFVAWREAKEPLKPPIGVRLTAEIYTSAQRGLIICSDVCYECVLHTTRSHFWYNCSLNRTACKTVIKTFNGAAYKPFKRWLGNLVASICNYFRNNIFSKYKLSFHTTLNNRPKLFYLIESWKVRWQANVLVAALFDHHTNYFPPLHCC